MIALFTYAVELGFLALMKSLGQTEHSSAVISVVILIFTLAYMATVTQHREYVVVSNPLIAGYIWRVALMYFDIFGKSVYNLPNSGTDSEGFYRRAVAYALGERTDPGGFPGLMGSFFRVFGISRLSGQFLVTLFSIVSLMYMAKMLDLLDIDLQTRRRSMWIVGLLPNFAILSVLFLRESIVAMFITLSLYSYLRWVKGKSELNFFVAVALSFAGAIYHSGAIAAAVGYALSRLVYDRRSGKLKLTAKNIFMTALLLIASTYFLNNYGDDLLSKFQGVDSLGDVANMSELGGSSYAAYVGNSSNPLNMIIFTIPRMFFFLFSPMPWMIRGLPDIIAFLFSSCYYLMVLIAVFKYLQKPKDKNRALLITIFIVAMSAAFVFGWGTSNSGTACRHRDKMTVVWGVLYALSKSRKRERINYD